MPTLTQLAVDGFAIAALVLLVVLSLPFLRRHAATPARERHEHIEEPVPAPAGRS